MPSYINAIGTANPSNRFTQETISDFMLRASSLNNEEARKLRAVYKMSGIKSRYSVIADYGKVDRFDFYNEKDPDGFRPGTFQRMKLYKDNAAALSISAIREAMQQTPYTAKDFTQLITVSCTGMYAPGLDIDIVHELGMNLSVNRTNIYFMGCYAAINALRTADAICRASPNEKILVVCTELCSIHFQNDHTEDNLLANALFADGAAAVIVSSEATSNTKLQIDSFYNTIADKGAKDMAWNIGNTGFEMKLSSYVPEIIGSDIKSFLQVLLSINGNTGKTVDYYAIHPGGKKILEQIEKSLDFSSKENRYAYKVLENYGNMSSATILFVLKELLNDLPKDEKDKTILGMSFGPGLTLEGMLLQTV